MHASNIVRDRVAAVAVRADVDPENATRRPTRKLDERSGMARAVEAEPVDDATLAHQPEHARARISGLRLRRYGAHLGKAEADAEERIVDARVLVVACRDADGVWKGEAEQGLREALVVRLRSPRVDARFERTQRSLMRRLRIEKEEARLGRGPETVHDGRSGRMIGVPSSASGAGVALCTAADGSSA